MSRTDFARLGIRAATSDPSSTAPNSGPIIPIAVRRCDWAVDKLVLSGVPFQRVEHFVTPLVLWSLFPAMWSREVTDVTRFADQQIFTVSRPLKKQHKRDICFAHSVTQFPPPAAPLAPDMGQRSSFSHSPNIIPCKRIRLILGPQGGTAPTRDWLLVAQRCAAWTENCGPMDGKDPTGSRSRTTHCVKSSPTLTCRDPFCPSRHRCYFSCRQPVSYLLSWHGHCRCEQPGCPDEQCCIHGALISPFQGRVHRGGFCSQQWTKQLALTSIYSLLLRNGGGYGG